MTEQTTDQPEAAPSALPEGFKTDGERIVAELSKMIEGMPILTVSTALVATLFAATTQNSLDRPAKEALTVMLYDLLGNVMNANEISEERLKVIMAQRGEQAIMATPAGAVVIDAPQEQEQG